jgi:E3 ubiquitin-protein ligase UBR7
VYVQNVSEAPQHIWLTRFWSNPFRCLKFGFCYACSLNCHIDHVIPLEGEDGKMVEKDAIIELFDKRSFRCDCPCTGSCQLFKKDALAEDGFALAASSSAAATTLPDWNEDNQYNHNYDGLYCWCNQTYDHDSDVIMVQCEICQDWYHQQCIETETGSPIPVDEDEEDGAAAASVSDDQGSSSQFVCRDCVHKYAFLQKYSELVYVKRAKNAPALINSLIDSTTCHIQAKGLYPFRRGFRNY